MIEDIIKSYPAGIVIGKRECSDIGDAARAAKPLFVDAAREAAADLSDHLPVGAIEGQRDGALRACPTQRGGVIAVDAQADGALAVVEHNRHSAFAARFERGKVRWPQREESSRAKAAMIGER